MTPTDIGTYIDAAEASALWRSAKNWLLTWASAGFVPTERDGKFFMPSAWAEKFPDGPLLVDALRTEMTALIRDGKKAVANDPRLKAAYPDYLRKRIADAALRRKHADRVAEKETEELKRLRDELDSVGEKSRK